MNNIEDFRLYDARTLQTRLMAEVNLPIAYAAILAENALNRFDPRVLEGVKLWMNGQLSDDFSVGDATIGEIRECAGLTGFQALCYMDVYLKHPDFVAYDVDWFEGSFD